VFFVPNVYCIIANCASVVAAVTVADGDDRGDVDGGGDGNDGDRGETRNRTALILATNNNTSIVQLQNVPPFQRRRLGRRRR